MPTATDLVTDLPADFEVFGQAVATSMADLLGGTSGQILAKNSNTDMDFVWIANDQGDITGITASSPLTGGGTSGAVTVGIQDALTTQKGAVQLSDSTSTTSSILAATPTAVKSAYDLADAAIAKSTVTTAGDIIYRNATVPVRLGIGTAGQLLRVNSGATAPEWATISTSPVFVGCSLTKSAAQSIADGANVMVTFDVEGIDTDGFHDNSSNNERITIPSGKGGKYLITAQIVFASNATSYRQLYLFKNTTQVSLAQCNSLPSPGVGPTLNIAYVVSATAGDYFLLKVFQNTGGALNLNSDAFSTGITYFTATFLGA
jgi:hypothetical protein